jgi:hypothetical protein
MIDIKLIDKPLYHSIKYDRVIVIQSSTFDVTNWKDDSSIMSYLKEFFKLQETGLQKRGIIEYTFLLYDAIISPVMYNPTNFNPSRKMLVRYGIECAGYDCVEEKTPLLSHIVTAKTQKVKSQHIIEDWKTTEML